MFHKQFSRSALAVLIVKATAGARPGFITSEDGRCGTSQISCHGSTFGSCCSEGGFCGSDAISCGQGCQPEFGFCGSISDSQSGIENPVNNYLISAPIAPEASVVIKAPITTFPAISGVGDRVTTLTIPYYTNSSIAYSTATQTLSHSNGFATLVSKGPNGTSTIPQGPGPVIISTPLSPLYPNTTMTTASSNGNRIGTFSALPTYANNSIPLITPTPFQTYPFPTHTPFPNSTVQGGSGNRKGSRIIGVGPVFTSDHQVCSIVTRKIPLHSNTALPVYRSSIQSYPAVSPY